MIDKCIKEDTPIVEIEVDNLIEFNLVDTQKFNSIAESISLETGVPKELIYTAPSFFFINHWHKINDEWYFYKSDGCDIHFINELLGEVISEYFSLDTIHYHVAKLIKPDKSIEYGLVSKNFCDKDLVYKRSWDYNLMPKRNLDVLKDLRNICKSRKEYIVLLDDMKKFFIRDFHVSQKDRTGNNFLFKETKEGIRLAPLYDYEKSFDTLDLGIYRNQIGEINIYNSDIKQLLKKDKKFQELLHLLMDANIRNFIDTVEERHSILVLEDDKEYYEKYERELKKKIRENKLIK